MNRVHLLACFIIFFANPSVAQDEVNVSDMVAKYRGSLVYLKVDKRRMDTGNIEPFSGTGFIISKEGHILTSCHLLALTYKEEKGNIIKFDKVTVAGAISSKWREPKEEIEEILCDREFDMALLKFKDSSQVRKPVQLDIESKYDFGLSIGSMGFPKNTEFFSKKGSYGGFAAKDRYLVEMTLEEGDSGSPVFDKKLNVIGMVNSGVEDSKISVVSPLRHGTMLLVTAGVVRVAYISEASNADIKAAFDNFGSVVQSTSLIDSLKSKSIGFEKIEDIKRLSVSYPVVSVGPNLPVSDSGKKFDLKSVKAIPGYRIVSSHVVIGDSKDADVLSVTQSPSGQTARVALALPANNSNPIQFAGVIQTIQVKDADIKFQMNCDNKVFSLC